jgi:2,3-bisphosphoglycerate-independent phosphoglycerate mutase
VRIFHVAIDGAVVALHFPVGWHRDGVPGRRVDKCVGQVVEAAKANDYEVIIIADHGNADNAENEDGSPNTAHSLNPVPFIYVTERKDAKVENGILADVAPSLCKIMGIEKPAEMTGRNLINW